MSRKAWAERALQHLENLETTSQIANFLLINNHRGSAGNGGSCPVYHYMRAAAPRPVHAIWVGRTLVDWRDGDGRTLDLKLENWPAVAAFVEHFDDGGYPELRAGRESD